MTHHTHSSAARTLALLLASLLLLVVAPAFAGNGSTLTGYIPDNSKAVLSVDVAALRTSGALDALMRSTGADAKLNGVVGRLNTVGFNPRTQINSALVIVDGFDKNSQPLILIEGPFPREAIETALTQEASATRALVGEIPMYTRGTRGSIAFLAPGIAAIGPTAAVRSAARIASGAARSAPNRVLARELGRADKSKNLWFVGIPPAQHLKGTPLEGAKVVRGAANISAALDLTVDAIMNDAAAATEAANKGKDQLATMAARDEIAALGLAPVVNATNISARNDAVRVTLNLDQARFRRLLTTVVTVIQDQMR